MCGLFGTFSGSSLTNFHYNTFNWLMDFSVTRGEHSTGVAIRKTNLSGTQGEVIVLKAQGRPHNLVHKFPEFFDPLRMGILPPSYQDSYRFLLGHVRAATRGAQVVENAHPFLHGHIVGAHNGTLDFSYKSLPEPEGKGETDSERVFYALSLPDWDIDRVVREIGGAMALTWYDCREKTFNLYRNNERTLFFAEHAGTVYYASEDWILRQALLAGKNPEYVPKIQAVETETLYTWDTTKLTMLRKERKLAAKPKTMTRGGYYPFDYGKGSNALPDYTHYKDSDVGWRTQYFSSEKEFERATKGGCAMCGKNLTLKEHHEGKVKFLELDTPLCETCAREWQQGAA